MVACMFINMINVNSTHSVISFQAKKNSIGNSKDCPLTEFSVAGDKVGFDGNTLLLECENNEYVYVSGL